MSEGVWKGVQMYVIGHSKNFLLHKFFDYGAAILWEKNVAEKEMEKMHQAQLKLEL